MKKLYNKYILLVIFALFLFIFAIFSTKIGFHDTGEYITIAKHFAGIKNVDIFTAHSLIYPLIISLFIKIWPSLTMIKIVNTLWILLIGLVLLWIKNKKAFIIFAFSPLVWITSIQTTPILPASLFFLLTFVFYKKKNLIWSGLFLGLSSAIYTPMILVGFFFILIYFWDRSFKDFIKFSISISLGFLPRIILDYYLFKMPFYSLIRYVGANLIVILGLNSQTTTFHLFSNLKVLLIFFAISPLLFKLHKLDFKNYKKEIIFLSIIFLIILFRASLLKYFIIISPIIILLLVKVLNKKDIKWHCIISIFIIIFLTWNYFTPNQENLIESDLKNINKDYNVDYIIAGPFEAPEFATFLWKNKPYFVWFQDFIANQENRTTIRSYDFNFDSKIPLKDRLIISANFNRFENKTYEDFIIVTKESEDNLQELADYNLRKCYNLLCVYEA